MKVLLLASHGIAEYDDVRMFTHLGIDVFCPGGYADPAHPGETLRPGIPEAPNHPELAMLCIEQRERHAGESADWAIDWAKADLHPDLIDWADAIIVHHFPERWIGGQWDRIREKRVIWRTCGQSDPWLEQTMKPLHRDGLQIVRYSPKEKESFVYSFAGEDDMIRFGKFASDYGPWTGDDLVVGNVTQHMLQRAEATGYDFWRHATAGLPTKAAGPGSDLIGGIGALDYPDMLEYLRHLRAYLYTGTQPASYTLGLIEAMLSGVPVVSIPKSYMRMPGLFEGDELATDSSLSAAEARAILALYLRDEHAAQNASHLTQDRAVRLFGMDTIGPRWLAFLGAKVPVTA